MAADFQDSKTEFLSTLPATDRAHWLACAVILCSAVFFLAAAPFAKTPLPQMGAFLPVYQSALIINELITALLLFGQFNILRHRALLVLACAYLLSALMAAAHLLSFPGLFSPTGLLGANAQTTAWLYFLWHGTFPLLVVVYALHKGEGGSAASMKRPGFWILAGAIATVGLTALFIGIATVGAEALPAIMQGNQDTPAKMGIALATWFLCLSALVILWRRGTRSVLDLWLMVVMFVWIFDIALAAVLNAGRFDLGWYSGRVFGLLGASFVLAVLLLENSMLYAKLARAHRQMGELNTDLESFSYSVSHDLRSPLRAVNGYVRILQEDHAGSLDAEGRRLLDVVIEQSARMGELIQDLLEFSRLGRQAILRSEFNTSTVIDDVMTNVPFQGRFSCDALATTSGDRSLLRQVWENLLSNAAKYSAKQENPEIHVGGYREDGFDVFYVRDNGAGFDMKYYDKLFGVFQRLHAEKEFSGTGIGLAIVQKIVNRHGGRVWAQGAIGKGATFYFSIPVGKSPHQDERPVPASRLGAAL